MTQRATFAAGCFWGVEAAFRQIPGVVSTRVGYTGGHTENPTYSEVCGKRTGHAEAVEVTFDPSVVSYEELLDVFWRKHNPRSRNRQGLDVGSQYRSAIFFHSPEQEAAARRPDALRPSSLAAEDLDADRAADLLGGRGLPPAVPREARPLELPRRLLGHRQLAGTTGAHPPVGSERLASAHCVERFLRRSASEPLTVARRSTTLPSAPALRASSARWRRRSTCRRRGNVQSARESGRSSIRLFSQDESFRVPRSPRGRSGICPTLMMNWCRRKSSCRAPDRRPRHIHGDVPI